jgi:probable rRNA maturation factor
MHEINRQYLGHDYPTDVISFSWPASGGVNPRSNLSAARRTNNSARVRRRAEARGGRTRKTSGGPSTSSPRGAGKFLDGEIIISVETARRNALRFGCRPRDEVCLYLVHGLLHLCGYDDLSSGERRVMRAREADILAHWNLKPRYGGSQRK